MKRIFIIAIEEKARNTMGVASLCERFMQQRVFHCVLSAARRKEMR
ncbi:MAG: hypothetical protein LBD66_01965 [Holosporales bacterium]|jgi:hypothetical protein|nr:hypothetical protein [Holosporales bacterium]